MTARAENSMPVSYTHLDVYKRQRVNKAMTGNLLLVTSHRRNTSYVLQNIFVGYISELNHTTQLYE